MLTSASEKNIVIKNKFGTISKGTSGGTAVKKTFKSVVHSLGIKGEQKLNVEPVYIALKRIYSNIDKKEIKSREKKLTHSKLIKYKSRLNKYLLYKVHYEKAKNNIIANTRCELHPEKYEKNCENCNKVGIRVYINFLMKARSQRIKTFDHEFNEEIINQLKYGNDINKQNLIVDKENKVGEKINKNIKQKKVKRKKQQLKQKLDIEKNYEKVGEEELSLIKFVNETNFGNVSEIDKPLTLPIDQQVFLLERSEPQFNNMTEFADIDVQQFEFSDF
jgi:phosphatidate phosphatase PAH1